MSNRAALIPSEQIEDCDRWQFASVGKPPAERRKVVDPLALLKLQQTHEDGRAEGHAAGRTEALAEAQARFDHHVATTESDTAQRFATLLAAAEGRLAEIEGDIARGTLEIACALARQVLRHELATNPNALEPVVREALGMLLADGKSACVRLSQTDFDMLDAPLRAEFVGQAVAVVADATVQPGDCLIESAGAVIDGGVANRWQRAVGSLGLTLSWQDAESEDDHGI